MGISFLAVMRSRVPTFSPAGFRLPGKVLGAACRLSALLPVYFGSISSSSSSSYCLTTNLASGYVFLLVCFFFFFFPAPLSRETVKYPAT